MRKLALVAALIVASLTLPAAGSAAGEDAVRFLPTVKRTVDAKGTTTRWCDDRTAGRGIATRTWKAPMTGFVSARLSAPRRANWDLGLFDASGNRRAASLGFGSDELAQTWVKSGERLVIQTCRRPGRASRARLTIGFADVKPPTVEGTPQLVKVAFDSREEFQRLEQTGVDVTHHVHDGKADVIVKNAAERRQLVAAGFDVETEIGNLRDYFRRSRMKEMSYAASVEQAPTPSGRTTYRVYSDYQKDLQDIATRFPTIVKPMELPQKSFQGRPLQGVEIAEDVKASDEDGRPVYFVVAMHHSREWPSAEAAMEFAIMLAEGYEEDERITNLLKRARVVIVPLINPDGFISSRNWPLDPADRLGGGGRGIPVSEDYVPPAEDTDNPGLGIDPDANNPCGGRPDLDLPPDVCEEIRTCAVNGKNPDGSCEAAVDLYLAEGIAPPGGIFSYRRKNCNGLIENPLVPCELQHGVDPNRNYGQMWGGPGSDPNRDGQGYRGDGMWSEPETQAVHEYSQQRQVTTIITIHNVAALVLRPPGLHDEGKAPDEPRLKEIGDAMANAAGYTSQYGFELYDTAGTTEDWNYAAAGSYGFTIEIGPKDGEFHMPYKTGFIDQWNGDYAPAERGKGLREALLIAGEAAANAADHSVITGRTQPGRVLRVRKDFRTQSYHTPFCKEQVPGFGFLVATSNQGCLATQQPFETDDFVQSTLTVPASGRFTWHVNPSTRPFVGKDQVGDAAVLDQTHKGDGSKAPSGPVIPEERTFPFEIAAADHATELNLDLVFENTLEDYDMTLCKYEASGECEPFGNGDTGPGSSGNAPGASEHIGASGDNLAGRYEAVVTNYASVDDSWTLTIRATTPDRQTVVPGTREAWNLTCETPDGEVLESQQVFVDRGQVADVRFTGPCGPPSQAPGQQQGGSGPGPDTAPPPTDTPPGGGNAPTPGGGNAPTQARPDRDDSAAEREAVAKKRAVAKRRAAAKRRATAKRKAAAKRRCVRKAKRLESKKRRKAAVRRCNRRYS